MGGDGGTCAQRLTTQEPGKGASAAGEGSVKGLGVVGECREPARNAKRPDGQKLMHWQQEAGHSEQHSMRSCSGAEQHIVLLEL